MIEIQIFSSFEEMKASEPNHNVLPPDEKKLEENLSKFIAISLLNPKKKIRSNVKDTPNEY